MRIEECVEPLKLDILRNSNRKQEWIYGRSFMELNIIDGWFNMEVIDPYDVLVDRYVNPWISRAQNGLPTSASIAQSRRSRLNPLYDKDAIMELRKYFATEAGLIQAGQNALIVADRSQRMLDMGVPGVMNPIVGETYVELNELH